MAETPQNQELSKEYMEELLQAFNSKIEIQSHQLNAEILSQLTKLYPILE